MSRDFYDPTPEQQNVILINPATLREAERLIESREHCNPDGAEIPFDNILDRVTGADPSVTDYILESPAKCSQCRREVLEQNADRAAITALPYARIVEQPVKKSVCLVFDRYHRDGCAFRLLWNDDEVAVSQQNVLFHLFA